MALTHFFVTATNKETGRPLDGVIVELLVAGVPQTLYSDRSLTPKPQMLTGLGFDPITGVNLYPDQGFGEANCYVEEGNYDIRYTYNGEVIDNQPDFPVFGSLSSVTFTASGTGATSRTLQSKMRDIVANTDYTGNITDAIVAVRNTDDAAFSGSVYLPNGLVRPAVAQSIPLSFARIAGLNGQTIAPTASVNIFDISGASHVLSRFSGFHTFGGVNHFNVPTAGEIASNVYKNLNMTQFTGDAFSFSVAGGVTSCDFVGLKIESTVGLRGIYSAAGINNDNLVESCDFTKLPGPAIKMLGTVNGLTISNVRVESDGVNGQAVFELNTVTGVRIQFGWYEAHHETLLKLTGSSTGTVTIDGIIDIGAKDGSGFKASLFDVGSTFIAFGNNEWLNRTVAPLNCLIYGYNEKLFASLSNVWEHRSQRGGKVHLKARNTVASGGTFDLVTFTRSSSTPNDQTNIQILYGTMTCSYAGLNSVGVVAYVSRVYPVQVVAQGSGTVSVTIGSAISAMTVENTGTVTIAPQVKAGATATSATIELVVTGFFAGPNENLVDVTFEYSNNSNLITNELVVTPA